MNRALYPLVPLSCAAAQTEDQPLVTLELPAEAVTYHLSLKSWAFTYTYKGDTFQVGLFLYERTRAGTLEGRYLTVLSTESDPSGQQHITFVIGPDGRSVPYSLGVDDGVIGGTIDAADFDLDSFNTSAITQPGTKLPSTGKAGTFVLLARYPEDGGVSVTGNPDDMEAYLALEVGQAEP